MEIVNPVRQRRLVSQAYERELLMQTFYQTVPITREVTSIILLRFFFFCHLKNFIENSQSRFYEAIAHLELPIHMLCQWFFFSKKTAAEFTEGFFWIANTQRESLKDRKIWFKNISVIQVVYVGATIDLCRLMLMI